MGYIRISTFKGNTDHQFHRELKRLAAEGLRSLIIDLRGNRGGALGVAVSITDRFLRKGVITKTIGRNFYETHQAHDTNNDVDIPLVLLVDGESASAAEVMIGALQDHGRAVVIGERTYGKGVVQGIYPFRHGNGGIKMTIAHYVTPTGRCIEKELALGHGAKRRGGLQPDLSLPLNSATQ